MRRLQTFLLLSIALLLGACSSLVPKEYVVTQKQLNERLAKTFPVYRELGMGFFRATLNTPELGFISGQNRISLGANFAATTVLKGAVDGHVALTSALRYDAAQRAIYLQNVTIDTLQVKQDTSGIADLVRPPLNMILTDYANQNPLYRFDPEQLRFGGVEVEITGLEVVDNGIKVNLKPH